MSELVFKIDLISLEADLRVIIQQEVCKALECRAEANLKTNNSSLLSTKEVCAYLHISRGTLIKLVKDAAFVSKKVGNKHLFTQASIEKYLERKSS